MIAKISARTIKSAEPTVKPYEIADSELTGFIARVQPTGYISYYYQFRNQLGKRQRIKLGNSKNTTPAQAREAAKQSAGQVALGNDPIALRKSMKQADASERLAAAQQRTVAEFMDKEYRQWQLANRKNGDLGLDTLINLSGKLANRNLDELVPQDFEDWRFGRLKSGASHATIDRNLAEYRALLNKAVTWGYMKRNAMDAVKLARKDNARNRYLSDEEQTALTDALATRDKLIKEKRNNGNEWRAQRNYAILPDLLHRSYGDHLTPLVLLALNTGLRKAELLNMEWKHVDLKQLTISVPASNAKSGKRRSVPINRTAFEVLSELAIHRDQTIDYLFHHPDGTPIKSIKTAWGNIVQDARLDDFHWHDLRHTFASQLAMRGVGIYELQQLLGHSDIKMTQRYAHLSQVHLHNAVSQLDRKNNSDEQSSDTTSAAA